MSCLPRFLEPTGCRGWIGRAVRAFLIANSGQMLRSRNAALRGFFKPLAGNHLVDGPSPTILMKKTQGKLRQRILIIPDGAIISGKGFFVFPGCQRYLRIPITCCYSVAYLRCPAA